MSSIKINNNSLSCINCDYQLYLGNLFDRVLSLYIFFNCTLNLDMLFDHRFVGNYVGIPFSFLFSMCLVHCSGSATVALPDCRRRSTQRRAYAIRHPQSGLGGA